MNRRRLIVIAIGAGLAGHTALLRAQPSTVAMRRVGVLAPSTRAKEEITLKPFFDEMRRLGWVEGANIAYDRAYADGRLDRLGFSLDFDFRSALLGAAHGLAGTSRSRS